MKVAVVSLEMFSQEILYNSTPRISSQLSLLHYAQCRERGVLVKYQGGLAPVSAKQTGNTGKSVTTKLGHVLHFIWRNHRNVQIDRVYTYMGSRRINSQSGLALVTS